MGIISDITSRIRTVWGTKDEERPRIPGIRESFGIYDMFGMGTIGQNLRIDNDLMVRYADYEDMSEYPILAGAYNVLSDDCTSQDYLEGKIVCTEAKSAFAKKILDRMLHERVKIDNNIWEIARTMMKYGNDFEYIDIGDEGVKGLVYLPPPIMRRAERAGETAFYADLSGSASAENVDLIFDRLREIKAGAVDEKKPAMTLPHRQFIWEGWQVIHWRNRINNRGSLYGYAAGESARWVWKRLTLIEDSALIFRLTRAPSRFVYYIDVGSQSPQESLAYVEKVKQRLKRSKFVNARTGKIDLKFNPSTEQDDIYIPVREGKDRSRVEVLSGPDFAPMDDIEYFQNKMFSALGIPKQYLGYEETIASRYQLSSEDVRYARMVMRYQQMLKIGLRQMCDVELAANNIVPKSAGYNVTLPAPTKVMETAHIELMQLRMQLAGEMREQFSNQWIMEHVLKLTPSEINEIVGQKDSETLDQADIDNEVAEKQAEMQARVAKKTGVDMQSVAPGSAMPQSESRRAIRNLKMLFTDEGFTKGSRLKEREMGDALDRIMTNDKVLGRRIDNLRGLLNDVIRNQKTSRGESYSPKDEA